MRPALLSSLRTPRHRNEKSSKDRLILAVESVGVACTVAAPAVGFSVGGKADASAALAAPATVVPYDVVQFDWDSSGDRDHTGIVTRVDKSESGVAIDFAGHTNNGSYKSVDETLANTGGTVSYWSVK
ncbi:amidase domain-containing protein [Leifsonia sp. A12D58]|uniref:amidase domain-containing protein n=1 Tax=Leifsonia sp. A12D58 TaxID=3397674 RepID=UPI0039E02F98